MLTHHTSLTNAETQDQSVQTPLAKHGTRTYIRNMTRPKPIRYDLDTWLVMRTDPVIPKAVIQRIRHKTGNDQYLLIKWDLDPTKRQLMTICETLQAADNLVLYDNPQPNNSGPPNGLNADGTRWINPNT